MKEAESKTQTGIAARRAAVALLEAVLVRSRALDEALIEELAHEPLKSAPARDRGFARAIAATALRRLGEIDFVLAQFVENDLPQSAGITRNILRAAAAEILFMDVAAYAAVKSAVDIAAQDRNARHFKGLVNAVLRRMGEEGPSLLARADGERLALPEWLWAGWAQAYGEEQTRAIIRVLRNEAPLDLSLKNPDERNLWVERLNAVPLPTGSLRIEPTGRIENIPGFDEGAWWVQDAAAALPAKLLGDVRGIEVLDLCAAPGGKTSELAAAGAHVTALDRSRQRLVRLEENLTRLNLTAEIIVADALEFAAGGRKWPRILLDAPCTATGTARRHPDVLHLKTSRDRDRLAELQSRLIGHAMNFLAPGGILVYCTCSLEPEEGEEQIEKFLRDRTGFRRIPILPEEVGGFAEFITPAGDLRTLPCHLGELGGVDGFYAARLVKAEAG